MPARRGKPKQAFFVISNNDCAATIFLIQQTDGGCAARITLTSGATEIDIDADSES